MEDMLLPKNFVITASYALVSEDFKLIPIFLGRRIFGVKSVIETFEVY